ncbi:hypothetical protein HY933_00180 [Candidatus Falkowbacteria bacterium]|nr:hypothetical protein [Candidatus Falkowbacteria bacterium]
MLEHLFGSQARVKLLRIFLNHAENAYYVRELTRLTKLQINAVRRELVNLEQLDIIAGVNGPGDATTPKRSRARRQEKRYYQANVNHVLFPELRSLMLKAQLLLEYDLAKKIGKMGSVKYLALTGIFVGFIGAPTDLFVVGSVRKERLSRLIRRFEQELNYEINFTLMSLSEYKYRKDITDRFLYSILENKKIVVIDQLNP